MIGMTNAGFVRARSPEAKAQRREAILAAAAELGLRHGVRSVSLGDIARAVGIAKSALLRYFDTREDIYLTLAADGWAQWARTLRERLGDPVDTGADALAAALTESLSAQPLFCELLAHAPLNLERHVSIESARAYKLTALDAVTEIAGLAVGVEPRLTPSGAGDVIAAVTALAAALWQISHPPESLVKLYAEEPRLAHASVNFPVRLLHMTRTTIAGVLAVA
jgi:AcrR family transcriptional regulator